MQKNEELGRFLEIAILPRSTKDDHVEETLQQDVCISEWSKLRQFVGTAVLRLDGLEQICYLAEVCTSLEL
jgi:hypothetical protein